MKTKFLVLMMLAGSSLFADHTSIESALVVVRIRVTGMVDTSLLLGYYYPAPAPRWLLRAPLSGPGLQLGRWLLVSVWNRATPGGPVFWTRPTYIGASMGSPALYGRRYYSGYWRR